MSLSPLQKQSIKLSTDNDPRRWSVGTQPQLSMQRRRVEPTEMQTMLKEASIDRELQSAREMLTRDECLDVPGLCHELLLVHGDQWLEVHRP